MNGAEFDTLRRKLGLSIEETAELVGANVKTVGRWKNDENRVTSHAIEELHQLEATMRRMVGFALTQATDAIAGGPLPIARYRTAAAYEASGDRDGLPMGAHAMLCIWVAEALAAEGVAAQFFWADPIVRDKPPG